MSFFRTNTELFNKLNTLNNNLDTLTNDNDNDEKIKIKRIPTGFFLKTDNSTKILNSTDGCFINGTFKLNDVFEKQSHGVPLIQVYSPTLCPILVEIVDKYDDLM